MTLDEYQQATLFLGDNVINERNPMANLALALNEYQAGAKGTAIYPLPVNYPTLGIAGEACELLVKVSLGAEPDEVIKEVGDVLWYTANVAADLGFSLSDVAGVDYFADLPGYPAANSVEAMLLEGVGEVCETVKKAIRDNQGVFDEPRLAKVKNGLHVIVNSLKELCFEYDTTLEDAAQRNLEKLRSRQQRGVLQGSGDNR